MKNIRKVKLFSRIFSTKNYRHYERIAVRNFKKLNWLEKTKYLRSINEGSTANRLVKLS